MKIRSENNNPLAELIRSQREEIEKYRWIESEKAGRDIGWKRASEEWKEKYFGEWKRHVRERGLQPPLFEILWSQQQEIESYKWIESERRGLDIGWKQAVTEWQERYYGQWREHVWVTTLDELRSAGPKPDGTTPRLAGEKRRRAFSAEHREKLALAMRTWHEKRKTVVTGDQ